MPTPDVQPSRALGAALERHRGFLLTDDVERSEALEAADCESLKALITDVEPLFDEINRLLDQFDESAHPLPEELEDLEINLHALGQAGVEAGYELERRC